MNEQEQPLPDEIAQEYQLIRAANEGAPQPYLEAIEEFDARAEELAPERDRELEVETHFA